MKKSLSIDWLQLHVDCSQFQQSKHYEWKTEPYQTKQFKKIQNVIFRGEVVATAVSIPTSPIISQSCMVIKFKNRELYGQNLKGLIDDILNVHCLIFKSITRIDIAADFNYFVCGLYPETLIKRFIESTYLKIGKANYSLNGEQKFTHTFDYLKFGSKTSDVNIYLYNKTKELSEVHDKPYIRKSWIKSGLDITKPVWRLEVSIKGQGSDYLNTSTGEHCRLSYENLFEPAFLQNYYYAYIDRYFYFVVNDGKSRKDRMKKVPLFSNFMTDLTKLYLPKTTGSNRSDKIFIKKLYMLDQELRGFDNNLHLAQDNLLISVVAATDLGQWFGKNEHRFHRDAFRE